MSQSKHSEDTPPSKLVASPVHLLHRVSQCASDVFADEIGETDLTPRQYAVLIAVSEREGLSQTALVEETGIDRSTLADVVRRMLRKGLLERKRTQHDARAYAIRLTDEGQSALASAAPAARAADARIISALPASDRAAFVKMLQTIVATLGDDGEEQGSTSGTRTTSSAASRQRNARLGEQERTAA